jgi:hypothetical protein
MALHPEEPISPVKIKPHGPPLSSDEGVGNFMPTLGLRDVETIITHFF